MLLLLLGGLEIFGQGIELRFPKNAVLLDPRRRALHWLCGQAATVDASIDFAFEEPGGFEYAEMFGNGRERSAKGLGEFGHLSLALRQAGQDGAPGGVSQGAKSGVQAGVRIFNHMV